jgi:plastocyanin
MTRWTILPKPFLAVLLGAFAFGAIACSSSSEPTRPTPASPCVASGSPATVTASDNFAFQPTSVTVTVGQSVCWQNTGQLIHTVRDDATNGIRFNGSLPGGQAFVHTFGFGGTFTYRCGNHSNMTGTVVVNCRPGELTC